MMDKRRFTLEAIGFVLTAAFAAAWGCAPRSGTLAPESLLRSPDPAVGGGPWNPTRGAPTGATFVVNERVGKAVAHDCRYLGTIRGTVRAERSGPRASMVYAPQLTVDAEVDCSNGVRHQVAGRRISGPRYTEHQLANTLSEAARMNTETMGSLCVYRPEIAITERGVTASGVDESCRITEESGGW